VTVLVLVEVVFSSSNFSSIGSSSVGSSVSRQSSKAVLVGSRRR